MAFAFNKDKRNLVQHLDQNRIEKMLSMYPPISGSYELTNLQTTYFQTSTLDRS